MGEWGEFGEHTPHTLVASCAHYRMLIIAGKVAKLMEDYDRSNQYEEHAKFLKKAFYRHPDCFNQDKKQFGTGSQASLGIVLFSEIADEADKKEALKQLKAAVQKNEYHLTSGEVGLRQVFASLAQNGESETVYRMVMNETSPSYRFFIDQGLTTLPEYWNYEEEWYGMVRSRNHAMMGHVREWLSRYILGIRHLETAWKTVLIAPCPQDGVDEAQGTILTPWGTIFVSWKWTENQFSLSTKIPVGVTAKVCIPNRMSKAQDIDYTEYQVGSGEYIW